MPNQRNRKLTIIIFSLLTAIFCVPYSIKLGWAFLFFIIPIIIFLIIHLIWQIMASKNATAEVMRWSIASNVLILFTLTICPGFDDVGLFNPVFDLIDVKPQDWHLAVAIITSIAAVFCSLSTFNLSKQTLLTQNKVD